MAVCALSVDTWRCVRVSSGGIGTLVGADGSTSNGPAPPPLRLYRKEGEGGAEAEAGSRGESGGVGDGVTPPQRQGILGRWGARLQQAIAEVRRTVYCLDG
jgi:hypothetical protein